MWRGTRWRVRQPVRPLCRWGDFSDRQRSSTQVGVRFSYRPLNSTPKLYSKTLLQKTRHGGRRSLASVPRRRATRVRGGVDSPSKRAYHRRRHAVIWRRWLYTRQPHHTYTRHTSSQALIRRWVRVLPAVSPSPLTPSPPTRGLAEAVLKGLRAPTTVAATP